MPGGPPLIMPGGGPPLMPGGGPPRPIPGGGPLMPGGGPPIGWRILGGAETVVPLPCGCIIDVDGPPTPLTGPCRPGEIPEGPMDGTPRPAARPIPGPPAAPGSGTRAIPSSAGGGPSTVMETRFSPRSNTKPRVLFSSRSSFAFLGLILRNSSQSPKMRFMCLSKALNVPMKIRPSCSVHRIR
jgi:hypothetical protein